MQRSAARLSIMVNMLVVVQREGDYPFLHMSLNQVYSVLIWKEGYPNLLT